MSKFRVPKLQDLGNNLPVIVNIIAEHCYLPNPDVVKSMGGAVFPSIRDQKKRISIDHYMGRQVFLDDNTTPRWGLLWSHGISASFHPKGWTFAHVWGEVKDPDSYTNLANLLMLPECFASLTDKSGPLTYYLKFHAYSVYGWKPRNSNIPVKPVNFDDIKWNYFEKYGEPRQFVESRIKSLNNQRTILLRPLMGIQ